MKHLIIPDPQVRKGVPTKHLEALGYYIVKKQPEIIIILGDWWDFPSVGSWNSPIQQEGLRLKDDIDAGNKAMALLWEPLHWYNKGRKRKYKPHVYFLFGNHEHRLERYIENHPELKGLVSKKSLKIPKSIKQIPFLKILNLDGVHYSHYFYNAKNGRALGGTAHAKLNKLKFSYVQGHCQELDIARQDLNNGRVIRGLVAGAFYMHKEPYMGPQADHWRGCIMLHDVRQGDYSLCEIQLKYLLNNYL